MTEDHKGGGLDIDKRRRGFDRTGVWPEAMETDIRERRGGTEQRKTRRGRGNYVIASRLRRA